MRDEQDAELQQTPQDNDLESIDAGSTPEHGDDKPPSAEDFMRAAEDAAKLLEKQQP